MEGFNNYEYSASQKSEGKWLLSKILLILGYIAFATVYFVVIYITKFFPLGALIPLFLWIRVFPGEKNEYPKKERNKSSEGEEFRYVNNHKVHGCERNIPQNQKNF